MKYIPMGLILAVAFAFINDLTHPDSLSSSIVMVFISLLIWITTTILPWIIGFIGAAYLASLFVKLVLYFLKTEEKYEEI